MPSLAVPSILDSMARAGEAGLGYPEEPAELEALELCRAWGFKFDVRDGRVRLAFDQDQLVPAWISDETPAFAWKKLGIKAFLETESTNDVALQLAREGAGSGTLVWAECQTAGKGRKGRRWLSPAGSGLYFSLILRPELPASRWALLSHVSGVALARTLRELSEQRWIPRPLAVDLKWPNDVLISGRKAAGILLETASAGGSLSAAVMGVGINVRAASFPSELRDQVTSLGEEAGIPVPRRRLLVRYLYFFQLGYDLFLRGEQAAILDEWKKSSSMWKNTPVWIVENDQTRPGVTAGLTDTGALIVRAPDGTEEVILAGDVSIRHSDRHER